MASFSLPTINDNPDGGWGPSSSNLPSQFKFKEIPYAPYSKSDKLGRFADWYDISGDNRQANAASTAQGTRAGVGRNRRDGQPVFGSGTASAFAYFHADDESSFSLVDNKATTARRGGAMVRGRGASRGVAGCAARGGAQRNNRSGFTQNRGGGNQRGGARRGWRDWEKVGGTQSIMKHLLMSSLCRTIVLARLPLLFLQIGQCWRRLSSTVSLSFVSRLTSLKIC